MYILSETTPPSYANPLPCTTIPPELKRPSYVNHDLFRKLGIVRKSRGRMTQFINTSHASAKIKSAQLKKDLIARAATKRTSYTNYTDFQTRAGLSCPANSGPGTALKYFLNSQTGLTDQIQLVDYRATSNVYCNAVSEPKKFQPKLKKKKNPYKGSLGACLKYLEHQTKILDGGKSKREIVLAGLSTFASEAKADSKPEHPFASYSGCQILKNETSEGTDSHYRRDPKADDSPKKEHLVSIKSMAVQGPRSVEASTRSSVDWSKRYSRVFDLRLLKKVAKRGRRVSKRSSCEDFPIDERSLKQSELDYEEGRKRFDTENSVGFQDPKMQPTQSYREDKFMTYQKFKEISLRDTERRKLTHRNIFCAETDSPVERSHFNRPRFVQDS
jgi:hypothetical protein